MLYWSYFLNGGNPAHMSVLLAETAQQIAGGPMLRALAEELKLPLLQIARQAELFRDGATVPSLEDIETAAAQALWFIDSYLLSQQLWQQASLELEPVTVSAVLQDAAHSLDRLAKQYRCSLAVDLDGRYRPVMAHRQALQAALVGLGSTLITAPQPDKNSLVLAAHKTSRGVVAGAFSHTTGLSQAMYRQGRALFGQARQPLYDLTAQTAAGVYLADTLLSSMAVRLRVARHQKLTGLAVTLQPSRQLALI